MRRNRIGLTESRFCVEKSRVTSDGDGWICRYGNNVRVINRVVHQVGLSRESADDASRDRSEQADDRAEGREYREAFGNIANLCALADEESTDTEELSVVEQVDINLGSCGNEFILFAEINELGQAEEVSAVDSEDGVVPRIRIPKDDRIVMMGKLADAVDNGRYVPTVGENKGQITLWWRKSEKNEHWGKYTRAIDIMRKNIGTGKRY